MYPKAKLVVGNSEVAIETKFKKLEYPVIIHPKYIPELNGITVEESGLRVGASCTITSLMEKVIELKTHGHDQGHEGGLWRYNGLVALEQMLQWFASNHVRNVACVAGNIVTASPISDLNPMLVALQAVLTVSSLKAGRRTVPIQQFFLGYRRVDLLPEEILETVFIPFCGEFEYVMPFKQARRREDDISIVTAGLRFRLAPHAAPSETQTQPGWTITECDLAFGGMAPTTIRAKQTAAALVGKTWNSDTIRDALSVMRAELALDVNVPGGQAEYRLVLSLSALYRAYLKVTADLKSDVNTVLALTAKATRTLSNGDSTLSSTEHLPDVPEIDPREGSAAEGFVTLGKPHTRGEQRYSVRTGSLTPSPALPLAGVGEAVDEERAPVGLPLMHKSAPMQVSGEAIYVDDMNSPPNTLYAALVTSTVAHAKVLSIDATAAAQCPGFRGFYSAKDIKGYNKIGAVLKDEEVFVTEEVLHYGQALGVVVADSHEEASYAALKVAVQYEPLPAIISIEEAIAANSFFPEVHSIFSGDMTAAEAASDVVVEGELKTGGQEHFYLETNCSLVIPLENGQMEVFSSTQNPTKTQNFCASVCGVPASHVLCRMKRMGGGFGGKETRSVFIACAAAIAAQNSRRPVRINIERDLDMSVTGQRHAFYFKYRAGCTADGILQFLDVKLYNNA
eukprot:gene5855-7471_t